MLDVFKSKSRRMLGIDITSAFLKVVEISAQDSSFTIENISVTPLSPKMVEGHVIHDIEGIAFLLEKIIKQHKIKTKEAVACVPDSAVISRVITINNGLNESEIEELILLEADKYIPFPIEEINLDFEVIGPSSKNETLLDVLIVASRSENVANRAEILTKAGLEAKVIEVESFAVERLIKHLSQASEVPDSNITAVIDVGFMFANLFVLQDFKIIFTREEEFGEHELIEIFKQEYNVTNEKVEQLIKQQHLPQDYQERVLEPYVDALIVNIKRALQFFFSTSHHVEVDKILLTGSIATLPNIATIVAEKVGIHTAILDISTNFEFNAQVRNAITSQSQVLMTACGLALRQI